VPFAQADGRGRAAALILTMLAAAIGCDPAFAELPPDLVARHCYTEVNASTQGLDLRALVHIRSERDAQKIRAKLTHQIWPGGLPLAEAPASVIQTTAQNAEFNASGLFSLLTHDVKAEYRLTIELGYGIRSIVYWWVPIDRKNKLILVHDGHSDDSYGDNGYVAIRGILNVANLATAKLLLAEGYDVMWLQMPLYGDNLTASVPERPLSARCGSQCDRHGEIMREFRNSTVSPFKFFLEPVIVAVNYAKASGIFSTVSMMGASGGGWTTLLAAALDDRIINSAAVASSVPLFLRAGVCGRPSVGDAEQGSSPGLLYKRVSYMDLYVLAAYGVGRQHLQINNQFDTCCFFGVGYQAYAENLAAYIRSNHLGNYQYHLDSGFIGHGYHMDTEPNPANHTVNDCVLPAFEKRPGPQRNCE
jgi:hypothetical protein